MLKRVVLPVVVPLIALFGGLALMRLLDGGTIHVESPVYTRFFGYDGMELERQWQALDNEIAFEELRLKVDLAFPFIYGSALIFGLGRLWQRRVPRLSVLVPVLMVILVVIADLMENLLLLGQMQVFRDEEIRNVTALDVTFASRCTMAKLWLLCVCMVLLIALGIAEYRSRTESLSPVARDPSR